MKSPVPLTVGMRYTAAAAAVLAAAILVVSLPVRAQISSNTVDWGVRPKEISRVGAAGWQFLKLPTDARSTAAGGIKSALGFGSAAAVFNNPASAADVAGLDVQLSTMNWVADIRTSTLSAVYNLGPVGVVGVNALYLNYGDIPRTKVAQGYDAAGNDLGIIPITEGLGTFSAHDLAAGIVFARQITNFLQVGGTLRYLEQQMDDARMSSWSIDIGTMYWTGLGSLRISMLGKNFGPDGEFETYEGRIAQAPAKVRLPMLFILGAAYDVIEPSQPGDDRLTVAAEYLKPNDGPDKWHLGAEYFVFANVYLRGGYRFNYDEETYTFGFGAEYAVEDDMRIRVEYANAKLGRFSSAHMLSVGFGW